MSPGVSRSRAWRARNAALPVPARKHRSIESALLATGSSRLGGQRAHLRLGQLAQREAHPGQRGRRERGQHVRLVLGRVGGGAEQAVVRPAGVVARGQVGGAEAVRQVEHRVQAHVAVAADARVRRLPRRVAGQERVDDAGPERLAQVERQVRQPHPVRERAGDPHGVGRAARRLGVVLRVRPQLERHRHRLARVRGPAARPPRCPRRRSWPPACARGTSPRAPARPPRRPAPGAARPPPARRRAACPARARPAPPRSRACPRGRPRTAARRRRASPRPSRRPRPPRTRRRRTPPAPVARDGHGDPHEVPAHGAAGRPGKGVRRNAPRLAGWERCSAKRSHAEPSLRPAVDRAARHAEAVEPRRRAGAGRRES